MADCNLRKVRVLRGELKCGVNNDGIGGERFGIGTLGACLLGELAMGGT